MLQGLAARTGLGASAAVRRGDELMFLCNFEGPRAPKSHTQAGHTAPLLGEPLAASTEFTAVSREAPDAAVEEVRRSGYAVEANERALGRASFAAPVRVGADEIVAAISVWGPASVLGEEAERNVLVREIIEAADAVSQALGAR